MWIRWQTLGASAIAGALASTAPCSSAEQPERYLGNVDGVRFSIPQDALLLPARYDGEDDWKWPSQPRTDRTFDDHLSMAELRAFDLAGLTVEAEPPGTISVASNPHGDVQVTYQFLSKKIAFNKRSHSYFPEILTKPHTLPDVYGLTVRQSDRLSQKYNPGIDRDYKSKDGLTWITCNNNRLVVTPYAKTPDTCFMRALDLQNHAEIQINLQARYLVAWKAIFNRAHGILSSWRVK